jgi:hypothetical protein
VTAADIDAPEKGEDEAPESPETPPASPEASKAHDRLPDDHPVVVALNKANKEAEQARRRVKEFEDKDKSDIDKANEAASDAAKRAEAAEARALRLEVASDKGLTPKQASRLVGTTREELEADADDLLADFKPSDADDAPTGGRPKERLRPGAVPDAEPADPTNPRDLVKDVPRF